MFIIYVIFIDSILIIKNRYTFCVSGQLDTLTLLETNGLIWEIDNIYISEHETRDRN